MTAIWNTLLARPYVFVFLIAFLAIGTLNRGRARTLLLLAIGTAVGFLSEWVSIRWGFPYGDYQFFEEVLAGEWLVGGVPVWSSLSFAFIAYAAYETVDYLGLRYPTLTGALLMVLADVVIDPITLRGDRWFLGQFYAYRVDGFFFGVPLSNFAGWFVCGLTILGLYSWVAGRLIRTPEPRRAPWMGPALYYGIIGFILTIGVWIGETKILLIAMLPQLPLMWMLLSSALPGSPLPITCARNRSEAGPQMTPVDDVEIVDLDSTGRIPALSAVMPAYNEQEILPLALDEALGVLDSICERFELIVVDDGSTDRTPAILDEYAGRDPRIHVLTQQRNRGYSPALIRGFHAAQFDIVFYTDADAQFDLHEIRRLYPYLEDAEMVAGYRQQRQDSWVRAFSSLVYNRLQAAALGVHGVRDANCAFKLFRRSFFETITLSSEGFLIDAELFARARIAGLRFVQVGVTHRPRTQGSTTIRLGTIGETLGQLFDLRRSLRD